MRLCESTATQQGSHTGDNSGLLFESGEMSLISPHYRLRVTLIQHLIKLIIAVVSAPAFRSFQFIKIRPLSEVTPRALLFVMQRAAIRKPPPLLRMNDRFEHFYTQRTAFFSLSSFPFLFTANLPCWFAGSFFFTLSLFYFRFHSQTLLQTWGDPLHNLSITSDRNEPEMRVCSFCPSLCTLPQNTLYVQECCCSY